MIQESRDNCRIEAEFAKSLVSHIVEAYYPSKSNHEKMTLYDVIAFAILSHMRFEGVYKKGYRLFIEELGIFPKVRYNKIVERLNRYEELLLKCMELFDLKGLKIVDSKPLETKELVRVNRHRKGGMSAVIGEGESVGFNPSKKNSTLATS